MYLVRDTCSGVNKVEVSSTLGGLSCTSGRLSWKLSSGKLISMGSSANGEDIGSCTASPVWSIAGRAVSSSGSVMCGPRSGLSFMVGWLAMTSTSGSGAQVGEGSGAGGSILRAS